MVLAPALITFEHAAQEIHFGAHRVLGGELDVVGVFVRQLDRLDRRLDHLIGLHAQLLFHVDRAGGDEGVDAPRRGRLDRLAGGAHVAFVGARQRADRGVLDGFGNGADRFGVARTGGGKAGLDDVDAELFQLARDADLLFLGHRRAGALFAVAQGGVENNQTVVHGRLHGGSGTSVHVRDARRLLRRSISARDFSSRLRIRQKCSRVAQFGKYKPPNPRQGRCLPEIAALQPQRVARQTIAQEQQNSTMGGSSEIKEKPARSTRWPRRARCA
jgi:hypothetical protein